MAEPKQQDTSYVLGRDFKASTRLSLQHFLWRHTVGFNLHSAVSGSLPSAARIAEVAAGNCLWLLDVAEELPSISSIEGFDISLAQCPPTSWMPENVAMQTWNIFEEPPQSLQGVYDVVHARLICVVVKDGNPYPIIENLKKLLKPGGWLQWDEYETVFVEKFTSNADTPMLDKVRDYMNMPQKERGSDEWKAHLPKLLNQSGFEEAVRHSYKDQMLRRSSMVKVWNDHHLCLCDEFTTMVYGMGPETSHLRRMLDAAAEEAKRGAAVLMAPSVMIARKPKY